MNALTPQPGKLERRPRKENQLEASWMWIPPQYHAVYGEHEARIVIARVLGELARCLR